MMLVSPSGLSFEFLNDPGSPNCQTNPSSLSNVTLNIADTNATAMPTQATNWPSLTGTIAVKPGSMLGSGIYGGSTDFSGPQTSPVTTAANKAAPFGSSTFTSVFAGASVNGAWKLFVVDTASGDSVAFTGWDLILTVSVSSVSTTTVVSSNTAPPAVTGAAVVYTATIASGSGTPTGTATFTDTLPGGAPATLCSSVALSGGQASCSPSISTEGNHLISVTYNPTGSFATSSGTMTEAYRKATTVSGLQFCNSGNIGIPGVPTSQPIYPSYINVTGVPNSVATLTVQLNGLQAPSTLGSVQMMLVSPSGQALEFLSDAGAVSAGQPSVNVTFADNNPSAPAASTFSSGSYQGTAYTTGDVYPAPAPSVFSTSQPGGGVNAKTFEQAFSGATSNGNWQLFVHDNGGTGSAASVASGWCISLTTNSGVNTTTIVSASPNLTLTGTPVTVTATVSSTSTVNTGTVTFTENGIAVAGGPSGPVAVVNGAAAFTTSSLVQGDHTITATYSGVTGTLNPSFGTASARVNNTPTLSGSNPFVYCNTGAIAIPATNTPPNDIGAGYPNPSNMIVSGLPGTINTVALTLKGYHATVPNAISSLLVGPAATTAQSFDFFSGVGGNTTPFGPGDLTFSDAAASNLGSASFAAGTYKPSSLTSADTFTASPFYTLPAGPYKYAASSGTSTFTNLFANLIGDGTWSLYFNQNTHETAGGANGGWCLSFTQTLPDITITASHSGTFKRGGTGTISLTVHNAGPGPTGGTITVTDNLPAGVTASSFTNATSAGWTCSGTTTVTCTSAAAISASGTAPFSFDVSVGNATGDSITNSGSVAGGGDGNTANNTFSDGPFSVFGTNLTINKTHTDPFAQGQTGDTYTITVKNTGALGTSTGPGVSTGSIVVTDSLPSGLTATGFSGVGWTCNALPALMCTLNNPLAVGASASVTLTVTVSGTAPAQVTNTGVLNDATDQIGTDPVSHADVTNIAAVATHYSVSAPSTATAGTPISVTVTALSAGNTTVTGYTGTVHLTSSDGAATLPANATLTNGVGTFSVTLNTAGNQTVTATDTVTSSITGTSGNINVSVVATHFSVAAPSTAASGTAFPFTVTALSASNATVTGYTGTVHFTSSDGTASLPANATLTNGVGTFNATLNTAGNQTVTATDTVTSSITGTSGNISVSVIATHFSVSAPATATTGTAFPFTVTALSAGNATATGYTGTVHFTSSDGAASLPANAVLVNGVGTFNATLNTVGSQTITATDTIALSITGMSGNINVSASTVQVTVGSNISGPTVSVDGQPAFTGSQVFTWTIGTPHTITTTSPQTNVGTQFVFLNWSDAGAISHTVTAPATATTYTANFKTQFLLTTSVSPAGAGSIAPATGFVDAGSLVSVSATPNAGNTFTGFSGALTGATNPQNLTVNGPTSVTANFIGGSTNLLAQISSKTGAQNARVWAVTFTNNGPGAADNILITGFTLIQQGGAACSPVVSSALPLNSGSAAPGGQVSTSVTLDFTGCAAAARFQLVMPFTANAGAASGTLTLYNQFR